MGVKRVSDFILWYIWFMSAFPVDMKTRQIFCCNFRHAFNGSLEDMSSYVGFKFAYLNIVTLLKCLKDPHDCFLLLAAKSLSRSSIKVRLSRDLLKIHISWTQTFLLHGQRFMVS